MAGPDHASVSGGRTPPLCPVVELRQLEYFLAVVEEGSFTRAAASVYMVQSSLSASLLSLERELGTELFIRGRRGAELTDAGRAFLGPARAALRAVDGARDAVAEVTGLLRGSVRAGVFRPLGQGVVDFAALLEALDEHGFDGWAVVEQDRTPGGDPVADLIASRQALEALCA